MSRDRLEEQLARLHRGASDPSRHQPALRAELVARFRRQLPPQSQSTPPPRSATMRKPVLLSRFAIAFGLLLGLGAASRVPADYPVQVGKRIDIVAQRPGADWPGPSELEPVLQQLGHTKELQVRARRAPEGALTLSIELWGPSVAEDAAEQLRRAFPALAGATITVTPLEVELRGTLGDRIGGELFKLKDPAAFEAARAKLQAQLQAELKADGKQGTVEVQAQEVDGKRKVMIKVEAAGEAPARTEDLHGPAGEAPSRP